MGNKTEFNIYEFINSKAIREHCEKINHQFTPLQTAYLINNSKRHTIKKKHEAFRYVIETMPDDEITIIENKDNRKNISLKLFLKKYMELQKKYITLFLNNNTEAIDACSDLLSEDDANILNAFNFVCFACCEPFGKGSIVYVPKHLSKESSDLIGEPFVLDCICCEIDYYISDHDLYKAKESNYESFLARKLPDTNNMRAYGYFQKENGTLCYGYVPNYLDLEFYQGELNGKKRILKGLGNYLFGEFYSEEDFYPAPPFPKIAPDLLLNAYHMILEEERTQTKIDTRILDYPEEKLKLVGLLDEE